MDDYEYDYHEEEEQGQVDRDKDSLRRVRLAKLRPVHLMPTNLPIGAGVGTTSPALEAAAVGAHGFPSYTVLMQLGGTGKRGRRDPTSHALRSHPVLTPSQASPLKFLVRRWLSRDR